jgi:competence protein ComEC
MAGAVVRVVDVGQGDCVVAVDRATGDALMMDCPSGGESRALAALQSLEVLRLRVAIVSHQHLDHLGGVYNVVTNVPTEKVKLNPPTSVPADSNEKKKLRAALRAMHGLPRRGISLEQALAGESGRIGCVYWRIMSPDLPQLLNAAAASQPNHASVVLKLKVEDRQMIISSDADGESWSAMDNRGEDLDADILQIPHHGGKLPRSSSWSLEQVIQRVGAGTHVISVGSAKPYGHPDM